MAADPDDLVGSLLDGRYRVGAPIAEGVLLREHRGADERDGRAVSLWLPHRQVAPAFEDIEAEVGVTMAGCRRVLDLGRSVAYVVGTTVDHVGPRPRRTAYPREVVAGWFRAVAGIIDRNHREGRWHGLLTCDDVAILDGQLTVAGFGFWVRADPEAIAAVIAAPTAAGARERCAPELAACAIGPAADLWALGRCTLALAVGHEGAGPASPAGGELASAALEPSLEAARAALRRRHPPLADLLEGLLHDDPDARSSDLRSLAERVSRALEAPYRDVASASAGVAKGSAARVVVPVFAPDSEEADTDAATFEPGTGVWSGTELAALAATPTPLVPQAWSPAAPIQVISMKAPDAAPRPPPRPAVAIAPVIRPLEAAVMHPRPTAAALGTIAPPRARTPPIARSRRWPVTWLIVALSIVALGLAAATLWR